MPDNVLKLPAKWVETADFERALATVPSPHASASTRIVIPENCRIMVSTAVRILSLANQLALCSRAVSLEFEAGESGTMGYLNRLGFFDHLSKDVVVLPNRPLFSGAAIHRGGNNGLVEIERINPKDRTAAKGIQSRLSDALVGAYAGPIDRSTLYGATWTIFSELIDNIYGHSATELDGFAALQVYTGARKATVSVSDSGQGIMQTLRPTLQLQFPRLVGLTDVQLLIEVFRQGVSRHGSERGCGLPGCAQKALKFRADLEVRLANCRVQLKPDQQGHYANIAYWSEGLPLLWGTHISFNFHLDASAQF